MRTAADHRCRAGTARALAAAALALGVALLLPRGFSDPVAVDPFSVRLAAVSLLLCGLAFADSRLAGTRPVLLAFAAITVPFCLWSAGPSVLQRALGGRPSFDQQLLIASAAQLLAVAAFAVVALRAPAAEHRPWLRLRGFGRSALVATLGGTALLLAVALAIPAPVLGREGIAPLALARDLPWLAPACALQAAAQELQFRGLLMGVLERAWPRWAANLAQATVFGLAHIAVQYEGPGGPFVPVTIALGVLLGATVQRTRSLWPAIIVHAVLDVGATATVLGGLYGY